MTDALSIDGFGPLPVRRPASVPEVGDLVREVLAAGYGLYPVGGGTSLDIGLPPNKPGFVADLRGLAQVIDYPARDMTITVHSGVTIGALQSALAAEGQRLPVDIPNPGIATIGGAVAANLSGPRRFGRGTLRDYILGIHFVTDEGIEVKAGGRVVKNVAGYDLMKLHTGALGTLGIVTQITLKVTPQPEDQVLLAFGLNAAAVGPTLDRLHASTSRPIAIELLNAAAARAVEATASITLPGTDPWVIVVGFEEKSVTVAWQAAALKEELKTAPVRNITEFRGTACPPVWAALTELQARSDSRLVWKASVLPSRVSALATAAVADDPDAIIHAHAGNGVVFGHGTSADVTLERASAIVATVAEKAADGNGSVVIRRCPTEWKRVLPVWGRVGSDRAVMRAVKSTLDPKNVFNPGRLFGDL